MPISTINQHLQNTKTKDDWCHLDDEPNSQDDEPNSQDDEPNSHDEVVATENEEQYLQGEEQDTQGEEQYPQGEEQDTQHNYNNDLLTTYITVKDTTSRYLGIVKTFRKTYGFAIITGKNGSTCKDKYLGKDIMVNHANILVSAECYKTLKRGEQIEFNIEELEDGKVQALYVTGPNRHLLLCETNPNLTQRRFHNSKKYLQNTTDNSTDSKTHQTTKSTEEYKTTQSSNENKEYGGRGGRGGRGKRSGRGRGGRGSRGKSKETTFPVKETVFSGEVH